MSFYVGQKVVCVAHRSGWRKMTHLTRWERLVYLATGKFPKSCGPDHGDVLAIVGFNTAIDGTLQLMFSEYPSNSFQANCFRPLDALTEQMDRIESEGAPVEQPEPAFA